MTSFGFSVDLYRFFQVFSPAVPAGSISLKLSMIPGILLLADRAITCIMKYAAPAMKP